MVEKAWQEESDRAGHIGFIIVRKKKKEKEREDERKRERNAGA